MYCTEKGLLNINRFDKWRPINSLESILNSNVESHINRQLIVDRLAL